MTKISKKLRTKLEKRQKELESRSNGGGNLLYIKEGTTRMRPLPVGEDEEFALEVKQFYLGNELKGIISPATFDLPCAIYEKWLELKNSDDPQDNAFAKTFAPRKRYLSPHIVYDDDKGKKVNEDRGASLLMLTSSQYQDLINLFLDEEQGDFTDPEEGYDIKYKRTGKGKMDTKYTVTPCRPSPLPSKYNKVYDIQEMVKAVIPSYEETAELLEKFLEGADPSGAPDEEETPRKKKVTSKKSKKGK